MQIIELDTPLHEKDKIDAFIKLWKDDSQSITQHSSGSTGTPKAIEIPKWKMIASAKMTGDFFNLEDCKSALLCMSIDYIGGKMMVVRALQFDLDLYVTHVTSNPLKNITSPIDFVAMVPLQVEKTLQENPEKLNLIKHLIIGGAPVSPSLIQKLKDVNCNVYSTFGMTETVSHIALKDLKVDNAPYKAIGNTTLATSDDRLVITSDELKIKELKTTDIVQLIDDKTFHWLGRADFVINSGGVKIHPEKVEEKIAALIDSQDFIISQLPDEKLGSKVIFIGEKHLRNFDFEKHLQKELDKYEQPKAYFFISSLAKTPSGKVDRIKTTLQIQ